MPTCSARLRQVVNSPPQPSEPRTKMPRLTQPMTVTINTEQALEIKNAKSQKREVTFKVYGFKISLFIVWWDMIPDAQS